MRVALVLGALLVGGLAAAQGAARAQLTPEQIIARYIAADGGRKALGKEHSVIARGIAEIANQNLRGPFTAYGKEPGKTLLRWEIPKLGTLEHAKGGNVEWDRDPFSGLHKVDASEADKGQDNSSKLMLDLAKNYKKLDLKGLEPVAGRPAYVVAMTPKKGLPITRYFDTESFLIVREDQQKKGKGGTVTTETAIYGDYRRVGPSMMAFSVTMKYGFGDVVLKITAVIPNPKIDDSIFDYPGSRKPKH